MLQKTPRTFADFRTRFTGAAQKILDAQTEAGFIPWYTDGPWDSWNHTECAMALAVMGEEEAARRAFQALADCQTDNGSWLSEYGNAVPVDVENGKMAREHSPTFHDTNFTAYCATGIAHAAMAWSDLSFAEEHWPVLERATEFVIGLQSEHGDIAWSLEAIADGSDGDALLAGNASIYKSLQHAIALGTALGKPVTRWKSARQQLGNAIRTLPERFDRNGNDRSSFAMDWYYPVLTGAITGAAAHERIDQHWEKHVHPELGCKCVSHEPWVTIAETCELVITLVSLERYEQAEKLLEQQFGHRNEDGAYWMGWQYDLEVFWPEETPTWTQAAVILAADALYEHSNASWMLVDHSTDHKRFSNLRLATDSTSSYRSERKARR